MLLRLIFFLASAGLMLADPVMYDLRAASGSRFTLTVEKTVLLSGKKHLFLFERYYGMLVYDPDDPGRSRVELMIDAASILCKDTWVSEKDLKKIQNYALKDTLAVDRYPELHFTSTAVMPSGEKSFDVSGMLTIRGIAKPVTVSVTVEDRSGRVASVAGRALVRLKDYGLNPPSAALGTIGTKNEMTVEFLPVPSLRAQVSKAMGAGNRRDAR